MDRDGLGTKPPQIPGVDELLACCTAAPVADADGSPAPGRPGPRRAYAAPALQEFFLWVNQSLDASW